MRVAVALRFTDRALKGANIKVELLDKDGKVLGAVDHAEEVGPEQVVTKGPTIDYSQKWDDGRAVWLDLPVEAEKAVRMRLSIWLEGGAS